MYLAYYQLNGEYIDVRSMAKPSKVEEIIKATRLPNYLHLTDGARYIPTGFIDSESTSGVIVPGDWRRDDQSCLVSLPKSRNNRIFLKYLKQML